MIVRALFFVYGVLFLYTGFSKIIDPTAAIEALMVVFAKNYSIAQLSASAIAIGEVYVGVGLIVFPNKRHVLLGTLAFLMLFTCYLLYLSFLQHPPSCGCGHLLEIFSDARLNARVGVARNLFLTGILGIVYHRQHGPIWVMGRSRDLIGPKSP